MGLSPGAAYLARNRGMCAYLLWSLLPGVLTRLFCRGPGAFLPAVRTNFNHSIASRLRDYTMLLLASGRNALVKYWL